MFLNVLIGKPLIFHQQPKHVCIGVGIAKKSGLMKYFIFLHEEQRTEFAIPFSSVVSITSNGISISSLRSAVIKNAYVIKRDLPVYCTQGAFLGFLEDAIFYQNCLTELIINNTTYPYARITSVLDAILLAPAPIYPIGQRIPAPNEEKITIVSKRTLKKVIKDKRLILFTLSLPPFSMLP